MVAALLTMGISTVAIGALPTYQTIGVAAPLLLALCRFGQGLGLGGEWGGAVLLAIENAPPGKRAWYGMFPQLGAPIGFFFPAAFSCCYPEWLTDEQFFAFGWRIPFLASAALVLVGLYVRLTITETPVFREALSRARASQSADAGRVSRPHTTCWSSARWSCSGDIRALLSDDGLRAVLGHHRARLQPRASFCVMQLFGIVFFALTIPISRGFGRARTPPHDALGHRRRSACSAW